MTNHCSPQWTEWTQWTHWTYPSYCSKLAKISTNFCHFEQYLEGGVSSDLFTDTGHRGSISCSTIQYTNPFFSIFEPISCVKSVLKRVKDKTIKKFYWSEGMSTRSSVSINIIFKIMNFYKNSNNKRKNNNYNDVKEKETINERISFNLCLQNERQKHFISQKLYNFSNSRMFRNIACFFNKNKL